jgi:hypothetical protein
MAVSITGRPTALEDGYFVDLVLLAEGGSIHDSTHVIDYIHKMVA